MDTWADTKLFGQVCIGQDPFVAQDSGRRVPAGSGEIVEKAAEQRLATNLLAHNLRANATLTDEYPIADELLNCSTNRESRHTPALTEEDLVLEKGAFLQSPIGHRALKLSGYLVVQGRATVSDHGDVKVRNSIHQEQR